MQHWRETRQAVIHQKLLGGLMRELVRSAWLVAAAALFPLLLYVMFQTGFSARE